ncbi:MAG: methanogenesis marker 3 protein [Halobacteriota archaeon]
MKIKFNGEVQEVKSTRLEDIIKELNGEFRQGCITAVVSEKEQLELKNEFAIEVEAGEARIKIVRGKESEVESAALSLFLKDYNRFHNGGGTVAWNTEDITAIGPLATNLAVVKRAQHYKKWDVFLGFGGFDPGQTYLMISKREHEAAYGTGEDAVIGRLTRGRSIIVDLQEGERIAGIQPIVTKAERVGFDTTDLSIEIKEGQEIFTYAKIALFREAPMSSEHFFSLTSKGTFSVDDLTHTYVASKALEQLSLPVESLEYRSNHRLSARNRGAEKGKVYLYKESRLPNPSHNVFGEIVQGGELIDYAQKGDTIRTLTEPKWMMVVGKTQKEAETFFAQADIEEVREGNKSDDAIVVDQMPALTMEIIDRGTVRTVGVDAKGVFTVELFYEEAPKTVWYFKKLTGLIHRPIGNLKVHLCMPGMLVLFQGSEEEAGTLVPENLPKGEVKKGSFGVTNMSRTNRGLMGIRLDDSDKYGPTAETFDGANLVLSFSEFSSSTLSFLSKLKEGDMIYVKEKD